MSPEAFRKCVNEIKRLAVLREPEYQLPADPHLEEAVKRILSISKAESEEEKPIGWMDFAANKDWDDEWEYSLDKLKTTFDVREICEGGYLVLDRPKGDVGDWILFAVMAWHSEDDSGVTVVPQFHGEGPSGNLREPRHTNWGKDGYLSYPNAKVIQAGLEALKEFFDFP